MTRIELVLNGKSAANALVRQGALSGAGQEHSTADDAVCAEQSVDEPPSVAPRGAGMSASGVREMACVLDENGRLLPTERADLPSNEIRTQGANFSWDFADLPKVQPAHFSGFWS